MIITRTPLRMSFFGGGTDFPEYSKQFRGITISTTIDKYIYVYLRKLPQYFEYQNEVVYRIIERTSCKLDEIKHPLIREAMKLKNLNNIHLVYDSDLPARTGLGTSSCFAVGMLNAFNALNGQYANKEQIAIEAIKLERDLCNEVGGMQDQIASAYGGFNKIEYNGRDFIVSPLILSSERKSTLEKNILMFYTKTVRFSSDVQRSCNRTDKNVLDKLHKIKNIALEAEKVLTNKQMSIDLFGELLDWSWQLKKQTSPAISNSQIDYYYQAAKKAGAIGGKLLGAGSGGFLIFYVKPEYQNSVRKALSQLIEVEFKFDNSGTRIIYYDE